MCCEGDSNAGVGSGGGVVAVSACMCGTHGSGVLSITGDVLETRVGSCWVVLCLCEVCVWILCVDGKSRYLCIVLGGYLHI